MYDIPSPLQFFSHLRWLDGRPLRDTIERYREGIFEDSLYTFDGDRPQYNFVLTGRAKKNWKTADLILAGLYRFVVWPSPQGNDCFLLANDEGQAADDLSLAKKLIEANPDLQDDIEVQSKQLRRRDGAGTLKILPAQNVAGQHGKTALFVGFDEIHAYRNWDLLEAMAPDPTRPDTMTWITSYASIFNSPGAPLYDMTRAGKRGDDERMFFSWYAADFTTDPEFEEAEPEERANPSAASWGNEGYLAQQKRRLPAHKYRRLHLNLPGLPDGAVFDADRVLAAVVEGRTQLPPSLRYAYQAFCDMSGGSNDDACLAVAHRDEDSGKVVLDAVVNQGGKPPFDPRAAVSKFVKVCEFFNVRQVIGDKYAGETFALDFAAKGISYKAAPSTKHELYEAFEPVLNAGEVELLDLPKLQEQALGLVWRGRRIDHQQGEHDDWINAAAGAIQACVHPRGRTRIIDFFNDGFVRFDSADSPEQRQRREVEQLRREGRGRVTTVLRR